MTLPNFLIIGAAKAGTTTLHTYLRPHPEIFMPARKELRFFAYDGTVENDYVFPVKTLAEYESYFAGVTGETAIGEATPRYLRTPSAAGRIHALLPDARLIVSLRNPVERSFSSYVMGVRNRTVHGARNYTEALHATPSLQRGYADDLETYFARFDRAQFHIVRFEDLVRDPVSVAQALYGFLGVATDFVPEVERVSNPGGLPRNKLLHRVLSSKPVMDFGKRIFPERMLGAAKSLRNQNLEKQRMTAAEREAALAVFRDDILRTQAIIGQDLSDWLRVPAPAAGA
jgi:hypothetical protein